jgi:hypothetical protein
MASALKVVVLGSTGGGEEEGREGEEEGRERRGEGRGGKYLRHCQSNRYHSIIAN